MASLATSVFHWSIVSTRRDAIFRDFPAKQGDIFRRRTRHGFRRVLHRWGGEIGGIQGGDICARMGEIREA